MNPDLLITIRIPINNPNRTGHQVRKIMEGIETALEEHFQQVTNPATHESLADDLGFGGNVVSIQSGTNLIELAF